MKLRRWQSECYADAKLKFSQGQQNFLCLATPGAGKTILAAQISKWLLSQSIVDFVIYLSPSVSVKSTSQRVFSEILGNRFDGMFGSLGRSMTYQSLESQEDSLWELFERFKIFVILDEVHHLAGHHEQSANKWGKQVLNRICKQAKHVLTLSGTPWRTDNIPITAVTYDHETSQPIRDYCYGLTDAIKDGVCRIPWITSVDNNRILLRSNDGKIKKFNSFTELLSEKSVSYQDIVSNQGFLESMLKLANKRLNRVKRHNPGAAGLIVASTIEHAVQILNILQIVLKKSAILVVSHNSDSASHIAEFESGNADWLVSVGMVSEGTDIPRLQVCCHLSRIRTELHFRQVIGRILRLKQGQIDNHGYLFIPCQKILNEFAIRLKQDIPQGAGALEEYIEEIPMTLNNEPEAKPEPKNIQGSNDCRNERHESGKTDDVLLLNETSHSDESSLFEDFIYHIQIKGTYVTTEQAFML